MKRGFRLGCAGPCSLWITVEPNQLNNPNKLQRTLEAHGWRMGVGEFEGEKGDRWEELVPLCPTCHGFGHEPCGYHEIDALRADFPRRLEALGRD